MTSSTEKIYCNTQTAHISLNKANPTMEFGLDFVNEVFLGETSSISDLM